MFFREHYAHMDSIRLGGEGSDVLRCSSVECQSIESGKLWTEHSSQVSVGPVRTFVHAL